MMRVLRFVALGVGLLIAAAYFLLHTPAGPAPPGAVTEATVTVGGRARHYWVHAPRSVRRDAPVVLALHPSQSSGARMRRIVGHSLESAADEMGFVVVYPDGFAGHFNDCRKIAPYSARKSAIDDVAFMRAIVSELGESLSIEPRGVVAVGYSNGGHMAMRLALEAPDLVDGIVAIAASVPTAEHLGCAQTRPLPSTIVLIEGTLDPINPYDGGEVSLFGLMHRGDVLSAQASAEWFATRLGYAFDTSSAAETGGPTSLRHSDWVGPHGRVRLVTVERGGHTVPQSAYTFSRLLGRAHASDEVLRSSLDLMLGEALHARQTQPANGFTSHPR